MTSAPVDPIKTTRLILRPVVADDLPVFVEMYSNPDVVRYLYNDVVAADEIPTFMSRYMKGVVPSEGEWLSLAVEYQREMMGLVSVCYSSAAHRQAEIGFTFSPRGQRHGFATEAAQRMLSWCFEELHVHRVVGRIEARNQRSEQVLKRLGMRKEAHLVQNEWVKGEWNDEVIYAITEPEWRALHAG